MAKKRAYVLDRELALAVRKVVNEHQMSWQPRRQAPLKRRGGGGGAPGEANLRYGIVTSDLVTAAEADLDVDDEVISVTPGTGEVQFFDRSTTPWTPDGGPQTVISGYFDVFVKNAPVWADGNTLVNIGCSLP